MPTSGLPETAKNPLSNALAILPYEDIARTGRYNPEELDKLLAEGWRIANLPAIRLQEQVPWEDCVQINRSWSYHIQAWDMLEVALKCLSTDPTNRAVFDLALGVAIDWMDRYITVKTQSDFAWYDMAVSMRAYRLGFLYDFAMHYALIPKAVSEQFLDAIEQHRDYLSQDENFAFHNNHGFFHAAGQLALARRFPHLPKMSATHRQAIQRIRKMLKTQFTAEGVHCEHSPDYHRMVLSTLVNLITADTIVDPAILDQVSLFEDQLAWFVRPDGYLVNFGDSDYNSVNFVSYSLSPVLEYATSNGTRGARPEETSRVYPGSGYFIVKMAWTDHEQGAFLAQTAAFHSRTHKHADDLSFVWYERGREILVDAGRYGYAGKIDKNNPLWGDGFWYADLNRMYVESTHAHNTVEVDGRITPRKGVKPYGSGIQRHGRCGDIYYCESQVYLFKTIRHVRMLVIKPGDWLLVHDWLLDNAKQPHDYRQWFHFSPNMRLTRVNETQLSGAWPDATDAPLQILSLLPEAQASNTIRGAENPRMQGWMSHGLNKIVPNDAVCFEYAGPGSQRDFATLFTFANQAVANFDLTRIAESGRKLRLGWTADGVRHTLNIGRPQSGGIAISETLSGRPSA